MDCSCSDLAQWDAMKIFTYEQRVTGKEVK